ncbi:MAG: Clp protease N-terminal domain-containing protein [Patescibacteria group bacterium]|jgi:ATP-dependent Clp protease ATP-binding subunit ClpA
MCPPHSVEEASTDPYDTIDLLEQDIESRDRTIADLRRENAQLLTRVNELGQQKATAETLAEDLQRDIALLRREIQRLQCQDTTTQPEDAPPATPWFANISFSTNAWEVLAVRAPAVAREFSENYVSTEHLLLAILRVPDCTAAKFLDYRGVTERIIAEVNRQAMRGDDRTTAEPQLTPRCKRCVELAINEAAGDTFGTGYMLLGLIQDGEGLAARVLTKICGVTLESARRELQALRQPNPTPTPA